MKRPAGSSKPATIEGTLVSYKNKRYWYGEHKGKIIRLETSEEEPSGIREDPWTHLLSEEEFDVGDVELEGELYLMITLFSEKFFRKDGEQDVWYRMMASEKLVKMEKGEIIATRNRLRI